MGNYIADDENNCPDCRIRMKLIPFEMGHELECFVCEYKMSVGYDKRLLTIEEIEEGI
jgi:uncharacterized paraquat-inducible protein A